MNTEDIREHIMNLMYLHLNKNKEEEFLFKECPECKGTLISIDPVNGMCFNSNCKISGKSWFKIK